MMKNLTSKGSNIIERHVKVASLGEGFSLLAEHPNAFTALRSIKCQYPLQLEVTDHTLTFSVSMLALEGKSHPLPLPPEFNDLCNRVYKLEGAEAPVAPPVADFMKELKDYQAAVEEEFNNASRYLHERLSPLIRDQAANASTLTLIDSELTALRSAIPNITGLERRQISMQAALIEQGAKIKQLVWALSASSLVTTGTLIWSVFK